VKLGLEVKLKENKWEIKKDEWKMENEILK